MNNKKTKKQENVVKHRLQRPFSCISFYIHNLFVFFLIFFNLEPMGEGMGPYIFSSEPARPFSLKKIRGPMGHPCAPNKKKLRKEQEIE